MATDDNSTLSDTQRKAAEFDRSQLSDKTRVFQLAKLLGVPSKEVIVALTEMGLVKVAQSSLSRAESEKLLDALSEPAPAHLDAASDDAAAEADEKIRKRVRKDVENEIRQIEEKVDKELVATESEEPEEPTDSDALLDPEDIEGSDELLTDVEPEVTPAPESTEAPAYVPIFKAPSRAERRRAKRASTSDEGETVSAAAEDRDDDSQVEVIDEPKAIRGSSRLEAQRRRRTEKREEERKRSKIVSQAEFLARRESVERTMVVRERARRSGHVTITQVGVLEDGVLAEHFVTSDQNASMIGNIYLGRVQNVLPSMEAAFIDIGQGRNGVLYAGEVDWKAAGLGGRSRRIEQALKSGDQVVVQVSKDPVGHKGARLTTQISLAGRYLVYVPGGRSAGISRKLPAPERKRLKEILAKVVPGKGGAIIRTAAEGVPEEAIAADVTRLHNQWETIQEQAQREKSSKGAKPVTLYEEPNLLVKVVRDLFNEDFSELVVDGHRPWNTVHAYVNSVAPDLADRLVRYERREHDGQDAFEHYRIDEQIQKALSRTVWLPSGGTLIIERTEAMTVIDVNTGKFTGSGGSLEETVTRNNLEAAEEIVRQMRLRDIGGMIIVDFIDMILPENQELVLRRLKEALGRDRTRHQVSEVTSLGLVQMTRKRLGTGLLETFSTPCECCEGRGLILTEDPVDESAERVTTPRGRANDTDNDKPAREGSGEIALDEDALDRLAASVISGADEEDTGTDSDDAHATSSPSSKGKRRGRRGGGRGRGRADASPERSDSSVQDTADKEPEKSFEQAVEEFESSPRRKRRTRGNSRSDYRPNPDDFWGASQTQEKEPEQPEPVKEPAKAEPTKPEQPVRKAGATRGRRRAVRRSTSSAAGSATESAKPAAEARGEGVDKPKPVKKATGGRGRRRAVRRSSQ
ncbi:translation initiation factor IF-2 N-terminal domain-containing protein [Corynebacterium sanguinis]|uniref:translation initiation factor IF-2 N-terminal domain-containing protein n=1 Tax=Corynebacterium sanguinis TaxID=2594913 RepID=UPI00223BC962|nr:translation initiation factor IF-2 N-terminal domain-containing protein [Corynebacterium sanguinis]MCT1804774.1 translation initiation factor IF-2 N-terminal domain-containing protein [Corynebacterium sanguinis]MCT2157844.1 translation initiation factor IF-2 N-terminal domain-containing protein [Corynebacterium sanguinis]